MASATCLPVESSGSISGVLSRFNESTIISVDCGVRIADIMNYSIEGLPILATLTSSPEVLNETDIEAATEILGSYLSQLESEVWKKKSFLLQLKTPVVLACAYVLNSNGKLCVLVSRYNKT